VSDPKTSLRETKVIKADLPQRSDEDASTIHELPT